MPISAASISAQDVSFQQTVDGRTWRWKTRMDTSGAAPSFHIREIITPFGLLRDTIPIPGPIIQAMSDSIASLLANFRPNMLVGPPSSFTFTVDEGRGFSLGQTVMLTNNGIYGSLLTGSLSGSAAYLAISPSVVGNLASNETGSFEMAVDSTELVASSSPYSATVTIQDSTAINNPQTVPITIVVRPKAVIATNVSTVTFNVDRPLTGPYDPVPTQQFQILNNGLSGSVLDYQIVRMSGLSQNWLTSFTPVTGTINGGQQQAISLLVEPIEGMMAGTYEETLRISGYSTNSFTDVLVKLVITQGS